MKRRPLGATVRPWGVDGADAPAVSSGSGPEGPRTQRYVVGLAMFFTATGTISLRADALPTDLPIAVENHNTATTVRWVRGPSGPLPPKAARNTAP